VIIGPAETPFEDGTFRLVMHFEEQYPNKPPGVKFISQMFHPNVYGTGELCLDILQNRWSPTYDVAAVLTSIQRYDDYATMSESYVYEFGAYQRHIVCSMILIPLLLPMSKRQTFTKIIAGNTQSGFAKRSKRAGKTNLPLREPEDSCMKTQAFGVTQTKKSYAATRPCVYGL
jgi:hypothetical protein